MSGLGVIKPGVSSLHRHVRRLNQVDASQPHFHITPWLPACLTGPRERREEELKESARRARPPTPACLPLPPGPRSKSQNTCEGCWREWMGVSEGAAS